MLVHNLPPIGAAAIASLFAGPVFAAAATAAEAYVRLPAPIPVDPAAILPAMMFLLPATLVGFLLALLPNLVGVAAMIAWGERSAIGRQPEAWIAVGAAAGVGIAALFGAWQATEMAFALIATSAVCAGLCRLFVAID